MTNEQAAIKLQNILNDDHYAWHPAHAEALRMAVEALKASDLVNESGGLVKDSQGDCISRAEAIDVLNVGAELLRRVLDDMAVVGADREKYSWGLALIEAYISDMKELPSAQPEQRWIPCSERLPEELTKILITDKDRDVFVAGFIGVINGCAEWTTDDVVAWMPLPEPYREDGETE